MGAEKLQLNYGVGIAGLWRALALLLSPRLLPSATNNLWLWLRALHQKLAWDCVRSHFDKNYYLSAYPDVAASGIPAFWHYLLCGFIEGRDPSSEFSTRGYQHLYLDVVLAGLNPLLHYAVFGQREGRQIHFDQMPRASSTVQQPTAVLAPNPPLLRINNQWPADLPLISIVIPCFNYGQYVEQAIRSILEQTFQNFEVIVVDGGSTDDITRQILEELEAQTFPSVRFFYREERHLVGDNRNFGISLARGRYICCLDADDILKPTYLEIAGFLAEGYGYDIVYPSVQCFGTSLAVWLTTDASFPEIASGNQISTVALFRKSAWAHVGGFRDWGLVEEYVPEDWEFWVRLTGHGFRAKSIRAPLMLYRVHGSGLIGTCKSDPAYHARVIQDCNRELLADSVSRANLAQDGQVEVVNPWINLQGAGQERPGILLALPFVATGGAERVFKILAQGLAQNGFEVAVITTVSLPESIQEDPRLFDPITPRVYDLPGLFHDRERWKDFVYYLLRRYAVSTIIVAGSEYIYHLLPEIRSNFPQIAIIDQLFNDSGHIQNNRRYSRQINLNIVPSQALALTLVEKYSEDWSRIGIIPHGVEMPESICHDRATAFAQSGLQADSLDKFIVGFFGRLSPEKSPTTFVEIAHRLASNPGLYFVMTGEGPEREGVESLIERYGLRDRIFAPGFVDDVHGLMALADIVVLPSTLDGMPLVVLEAQSLGIPVVASDVGSLPEMISHGETGFLCPVGEIDAFCARILELYESPEKRRLMGEKARSAVVARYSSKNMIAGYLNAIHRLRAEPDLKSVLVSA